MGDRLRDAISSVETSMDDATQGLPERVFLFATRITPMINVDLLIRDPQSGILLTWRDDGFIPPGWHIPGGIIRLKETMAGRIKAVARDELEAEVTSSPAPLLVSETILPHFRDRGHFISLLFECQLQSPPSGCLRHREGTPLPGQWAWHRQCPVDLVDVQDMYRPLIAT